MLMKLGKAAEIYKSELGFQWPAVKKYLPQVALGVTPGGNLGSI